MDMNEPSTLKTIWAISEVVVLLSGFFAAAALAVVLSIWAGIGLGRVIVRLARLEYEEDAQLDEWRPKTVHVFAERWARRVPSAWPTHRL